jgi:hypothetical protein
LTPPYEEFYYGTTTAFKFKPSSKNVKQLLQPQSLEQLTNLRLKNGEQTRDITLHFSTEDLITVTRLTRTTDPYGSRDGQDNHTIILKLSDYLEYHKVFEKFPPYKTVEEAL